MRRNVKKVCIFTTALVCAGFVGAGLLSSQSLQAKAETNIQMVEMGYGAALRLGDHFGMRFQMTVNQEWLDAEAQQGSKVRMLLIREDKLTGELTKDTSGVYGTGETQVLTNRSDIGDEYQYNAVIVDIPDYAYDQPIVARGCVELSDGSYVYTDAATIQTRSVAQVANSALEDKFEDYYEDLGKYLVKNISVNAVELLGLNASGTITPEVEYFANATEEIQGKLNEKTVFSFESSDPTLISVDTETGEYIVNGNEYGEATITVSAWGKTAEQKIFVGNSVEYQNNYTIDIPVGESYRLGKNSVDWSSGTSYSNGATKPEGTLVSNWKDNQTNLNLGNGLLVTSAGNLNTNDGSYSARWNYSETIDLNGKTSADTLLDLITLPEIALTEQSASISIYLTDTKNSDNYIMIRIFPHNWGDYATVTFGGAGRSASYDLNGNSGYMYAIGDLNGSSNIMFSFDYEEKALYVFKNEPADMRYDRMYKLADLDDANLFPEEQWGGFTNDTCYLSIAFDYVNTSNHKVQFFIRELMGTDFNSVYMKDYTLNIPEGQSYRLGLNGVGDQIYENSLDLGDGLLVASSVGAGQTRWTYSKPINLNGKTSADTLLDIMSLPQTTLTNEASSLCIYLTDTVDSSKYIAIRLYQHNWGGYMQVTHSGTTNWNSYGINGDVGNIIYGMGEINGSANIVLSFDYSDNAIYAFKHDDAEGYDRMFKVADLDDKNLFPEGEWNGFTNGTCYISVVFEGVSEGTTSVKFFVRDILGIDLSDGYNTVQ